MPNPVADAYAARADHYARLLGSVAASSETDRDLIAEWAHQADGPLLDVGCGPGHWTAWLSAHGHDVLGVDPVSRFVEIARREHPHARYALGSFAQLPPGPFAGILAWYSLIHLAPDELPAALARCRAVLRPGGSLLVGFFDGERCEPFDHAVTTAWFWPVDSFAGLLGEAGFDVESRHRRCDPGNRPHGAIVARAARRGPPRC